jgi:ribosomal-protein-alanine N-acetyltransferase
MKRWIDRNLQHQERYGYGLFSVLHKADRRIIGDCGLEHQDIGGAPEVELGYDLHSDYWNQGLATEAARAVRGYAFAELKLPRLVSLIRQGNAASARVAEKVGMRWEADIVQDGTEYWVYALLNNLR